jgi:hypothetical protein
MALKVKADPNPKPKLKAESKSATPLQAVSPVQPEAALFCESGVEEGQLIGDFKPENLIQGLVMAEILGKPRSRSRGRRP